MLVGRRQMNGFPAALLGGVSSLFASNYDTIEIRSALTPPMVFSTADLLDPTPGPVNPLITFLQPTIVLDGPAGRQVIAPGGEAGANGAIEGGAMGLGFVGMLVGIGYLLGRNSKKG